MSTEKPNIVLINCDDLGYGDPSCYGSTVNKTPAIDRLAAEGTRFTSFYMANSVCSPSRGAMMTGCYPGRIGFNLFDGDHVLKPGMSVGLNPSEVTVAKLLKQQGYATALVGKWHCGDQPEFLPTRHGFDLYYGLPYSNDMGRMKSHADRGRRVYPPLPLMRGEDVVQEQPDQAGLTERYVEESVKFIRANRGRPFFLYLAHMHVHLPHIVPMRFMEQSENGLYGGAVECIDWSVAAIMAELRRLGLDDDTLVVFTSDNGSRGRDGGGSNAPLRGGKGTTWEGGHRVPCVARWPGRVPAGAVCGEVATAMDFLPTFARLAGGEPPDDRIIDGKDIRPLLFGEPGAKGEYEAFFYYRREELQAVRAGDWKLHTLSGELYNFAEDVGEANDVAGANPDVVKRLEALAQECREDLGDSARGVEGKNRRPPGKVENPVTLTAYDPDHPYMIALYDGGVG